MERCVGTDLQPYAQRSLSPEATASNLQRAVLVHTNVNAPTASASFYHHHHCLHMCVRNVYVYIYASLWWPCRDALGLLRPGSAEEVLPVSEMGCLLQDATANAILQRVAALCAELQLKPHNHPSGQVCKIQRMRDRSTLAYSWPFD